MTNKVTIESQLIEAMTPLSPHTEVREALAALEANYGVLMIENEPAALLTKERLQAFPNPASLLCEACASLAPLVVVDRAVGLDDLVEAVAELLIENPAIDGAVVIESGGVTGVLPRRLIAEQAMRSMAFQMRGAGGVSDLVGVPQHPAEYFVCPQGDHVRLVPLYDPYNPPLCPNHGERLRRKPKK